MIQRARPIVLLLSTLAACGDSSSQPSPAPAPAPPAPAPPAPSVRVAWDRNVSIYDVLGRDESLVQLVQVPRRPLPEGTRSVLAPHDGPGSAPYRVLTVCGDRYCADGLVTEDQVTVTVAPDLSPDEREALGSGEDAWLERGIDVVWGDDERVSFYVATGWYSAGAAHSNASFECQTTDHGGRVASLADVFSVDEAGAIVDGVRAFLEEQRELDERTLGLEDIGTDATTIRSFVLSGAPAHPDLLLCLERDVEQLAGEAQLVRVTASP